MPLSGRQRAILKFIGQYVEQNGYPPTYEEIRAGLRISTKSLVSYHLRVLQTAGYLSKIPGKPRGIQLQ